jgi:hypothetical protein
LVDGRIVYSSGGYPEEYRRSEFRMIWLSALAQAELHKTLTLIPGLD